MSNKNTLKTMKIKKINIKEEEYSNKTSFVKKNILGTQITDASASEVMSFVLMKIQDSKSKISIFTPNPEIVTFAQKNKEFQQILNNATINIPDGAGIMLAGKLLKETFKERIPGIDFMLQLCSMAAKNKLSIGLLGAREGIAEKTAERLHKIYPPLKIVLITKEWEKSYDKLAIDILFVAFGFPKQEEFIASHLNKSKVRCMMAVGGSFDYISGNVTRAPKILRSLGIEWIFRLVQQPWRLKRQLIASKFFYLILRKKGTYIKNTVMQWTSAMISHKSPHN